MHQPPPTDIPGTYFAGTIAVSAPGTTSMSSGVSPNDLAVELHRLGRRRLDPEHPPLCVAYLLTARQTRNRTRERSERLHALAAQDQQVEQSVTDGDVL